MNQIEINQFISEITIAGNNAFLPKRRISPTEYTRHIKPRLDQIGGQWNSKSQCYEFPFNPTTRINELVTGAKINLSQKYHYYDTPIEMVGGLFMFAEECGINWYDLDLATARVLEPGAGRGNILKHCWAKGFKNLFYYELMPENRDVLNTELARLSIQAGYLGEDFLEGQTGNFDLVIANPPFRSDRRHIRKMFDATKEGGLVLTIGSPDLYNDERFIQFLSKRASMWEMRELLSDPEDPLFDGTDTGCVLIVAKKRSTTLKNDHTGGQQLMLL